MAPQSTNRRAIWQIAGGPVDRPFFEVFFRHGVGLIGSGDPGPWRPERPDEDYADDGLVRRFASEPDIGDIVLLRSGLATIIGIGVVAGGYQYFGQFDDVNGRDLQHARRIRWFQLPQPYRFGSKVFGANPPRFSRVWVKEGIEYAISFISSPPTAWQQSALPALPAEVPEIDPVPVELQTLVAKAKDLVGLYWDRKRFGDLPSEHELVTHFVIPFLRALGWAPEQIAVEWKNVDVALFAVLPRSPENCRFIIEAKRLGAGVEGALEQAKSYVTSLGVQRDVVVTDGIRYRMYSCASGFQPTAYANLIRLKQSSIKLFDLLKRP